MYLKMLSAKMAAILSRGRWVKSCHLQESYACKEEGNKSFKDKNFTQAVMFYSRAIEIR